VPWFEVVGGGGERGIGQQAVRIQPSNVITPTPYSTHFRVGNIATTKYCQDVITAKYTAYSKLLGIKRKLLTMKGKVKCTDVQALRLCTGCTAHRGSKGIALPFLDHGTRRR